jgi:two-component system, LytTR family, sensor kinase
MGIYFVWIIGFQSRAFTFSRTLTVQFCYLLFIAANYYFSVYVTIPRLLYRKKYIAFGFSLVGAILVSAALRVPLAMFLNAHYFSPDAQIVQGVQGVQGVPQVTFAQVFFNSALNIFIWVVLIVAGKLMIDRFRLQQYIGKMEQEKLRTELAFLNAQFNPHFLFNSLNSIYGQIDKTNMAARNMLLTFSDMLRYQLYECNTDLISIDKELAYIRNYVALQQARKDERLIVHLDIGQEVRGFSIAPLLFMAFIENAFKYAGYCEERENRIDISFQRRDDELYFSTFNTKETNDRNGLPNKGIGIANAKRRLELLYPDKYCLDIDDGEQTFSISLKINLK